MSARTASKTGSSARSAGTGRPDWAIKAEQADGFEGDGFAAGVGAGDDELAAGAFEFDGDGDNGDTLGFQIALQQRVPGVMQQEAELRSADGRGGRPHMNLRH